MKMSPAPIAANADTAEDPAAAVIRRDIDISAIDDEVYSELVDAVDDFLTMSDGPLGQLTIRSAPLFIIKPKDGAAPKRRAPADQNELNVFHTIQEFGREVVDMHQLWNQLQKHRAGTFSL